MPGRFVIGAIVLVVAVAAIVPGVFAGGMGPLPRAVSAAGVAVFGLLFVAVAARIVGIVGVSSQPTSGITLVTLLGVAAVFAAAGWTDASARAAVLTVGTIVAVAASKAGDISQDLKTGYLVGATPARQQLGQLIGASFACWAVAGTVMLLGNVYTFGSSEIPAPQATLMKTIVEGVLAGALPWGLVLSGVGLAITALLCGVSPLAFAIGVYLPLAHDGGHLPRRVCAGVERTRSPPRRQEGRRRPGDSRGVGPGRRRRPRRRRPGWARRRSSGAADTGAATFRSGRRRRRRGDAGRRRHISLPGGAIRSVDLSQAVQA